MYFPDHAFRPSECCGRRLPDHSQVEPGRAGARQTRRKRCVRLTTKSTHNGFTTFIFFFGEVSLCRFGVLHPAPFKHTTVRHDFGKGVVDRNNHTHYSIVLGALSSFSHMCMQTCVHHPTPARGCLPLVLSASSTVSFVLRPRLRKHWHVVSLANPVNAAPCSRSTIRFAGGGRATGAPAVLGGHRQGQGSPPSGAGAEGGRRVSPRTAQGRHGRAGANI